MQFGPEPRWEWIDIECLVVDTRHQRTLENRASQRLIDKIGREFYWPKFGALLVAPNEEAQGLYSVIDGQHRMTGALRAGIKKVPCVVVNLNTVAEQAQAFIGTNTQRVPVSPFAIYHARIAECD